MANSHNSHEYWHGGLVAGLMMCDPLHTMHGHMVCMLGGKRELGSQPFAAWPVSSGKVVVLVQWLPLIYEGEPF